jgi:hypothetical protein
MDDDLRVIDALLTESSPSHEIAERGRRQLQNAIRGSVRRQPYRWRPSGWLAGGVGLTAAATAVAVTAVLSATSPTGTTNGHAVAGPPTGRQILLAAAAAAAARPAGSGKYWYVKTADKVRGEAATVYQSWTGRDGQTWIGVGHGPVSREDHASGLWPGLGGTVTLAQIRHLPASPAALKAWVTAWIVRHVNAADVAAGKPIRISARQADIAGSLISLLYQAPASPAVRSAAFRVLASLPGVGSFPPQAGSGLGLLLPESFGLKIKVVIDPATSLVRSVTFPVLGGGVKGSVTVIAAGWTNHLPAAAG